MPFSNVPRWMALAGPLSSWINTGLILIGLIVGGIWWVSTKDNNDVATSQQVAAQTKQIEQLTLKVEEGKATAARAAEEQKKVQADALEKLTKELTAQIGDVKTKQDITAGQLQGIQVTNQGFIGRFDLIDQRLTQLTRQADSNDGRVTGVENRLSKLEADFGVLRTLVERFGTRK